MAVQAYKDLQFLEAVFLTVLANFASRKDLPVHRDVDARLTCLSGRDRQTDIKYGIGGTKSRRR